MKKTASSRKQASAKRNGPAKRETPHKASKRLTIKEKTSIKVKQKPPQKQGLAKKRMPPPVQVVPPPRRKPSPDEVAYQNALAQFETAIKLFNSNNITKARSIFERLARGRSADLAQRARVYLRICGQRLSHSSLQLKTADDHYNYGVQLANRGNFDEAEQYLNKALKLAPKSDYIHYALASTSALRENIVAALEHLQEAIQLNGQNRILAQNDPDFSTLGEDPRFTELLYPEKPLS